MDNSPIFDDPEFGEDWDESILTQVELAETDFMLQDSSKKEVNFIDPYEHKASFPEEVSHPHSNHINILTRIFGHKEFKSLQWKIISSIINERRDCCAVMMTGYGKSLCFQYPSVYIGGVTIIISPLISLMQDQVLSMKIANIPACLLGSANKEQLKTIGEILDDKYSLVYCTPEFCTGDYGRNLLVQLYERQSITLIAIDEAHCVSSWGHDFRHQYRQLGILRNLMPTVPILAVTATATEKVRLDIVESLKLRNPLIVISSLDRENFFYEVHHKGVSMSSDLKKVMDSTGAGYKFNGSTIIYCITRKMTEKLAFILKSLGVKCESYHAGLPLSDRTRIHEEFVRDQVEVVIATIAFGMGIDKPDVRNVIHYGVSSSIENYYQEAGRAGRDGLPAKCTIFYNNQDFSTQRIVRENSKLSEATRTRKEKMLQLVESYLLSRECRRGYILSYFEGKQVHIENRPNCCDNCFKRVNGSEADGKIYEGVDENGQYDFTKDAKLLLKLIKSINTNFGISKYINILRGSKQKKLTTHFQKPYFGSGKDKSEIWWKEIGKLLTKHEYISTRLVSPLISVVEVSQKGDEFLKNSSSCLKDIPSPNITTCLPTKGNIWINSRSRPEPTRASCSTPMKVISKPENNSENSKVLLLYRALLDKRLQLAQQENCMPYMIASNKALMDIAEQNPGSFEELERSQFDGMTAIKLKKYGREFLNVISPATLSIKKILDSLPIPDVEKISHTMLLTFELYQLGKTHEEIVKFRNLALSTIMQHLTIVMKHGYPVKLSSYGITDEMAYRIINAVKLVDTGISRLKPIKMLCPDEIDFHHIGALLSYLQVREHLDKLNLRYQDFEYVDYYHMYKSSKCLSVASNTMNTEPEQRDVKEENLQQFIETLGELQKIEVLDPEDTNIATDEPEMKRYKSNSSETAIPGKSAI